LFPFTKGGPYADLRVSVRSLQQEVFGDDVRFRTRQEEAALSQMRKQQEGQPDPVFLYRQDKPQELKEPA